MPGMGEGTQYQALLLDQIHIWFHMSALDPVSLLWDDFAESLHDYTKVRNSDGLNPVYQA